MNSETLERYTGMAFQARDLYEYEKDVALKAILLSFAETIESMKEVIRKISKTEHEEKKNGK